MKTAALSRDVLKAAPLAEEAARPRPVELEMFCPNCSARVLTTSACPEHTVFCPQCKAAVRSGNGRAEFLQSCLIGTGSLLAAIGLQTLWIIAAIGFSMMVIGFLKRF